MLSENPEPSSRIRRLSLSLGGEPVSVAVDPYSDRLRCDHPPARVDGAQLARELLEQADAHERGRIVVLASMPVAEGMLAEAFEVEGVMPRFYRGKEDCAVLGAYPEEERGVLAKPDRVAEVMQLVEERDSVPVRRGTDVTTRRATPEDAVEVASLLADTFAQYPTPSGDPEYVAHSIEDGVPFRVVEDEGRVVACASADLVRAARSAELTDCATLPECRGQGLMKAILQALMDDLRSMGYPTAFTLARAQIPGVNLAFQGLGFTLRGTMPQSCRIGEGIEDMNIWSRDLERVPRVDRIDTEIAAAPPA